MVPTRIVLREVFSKTILVGVRAGIVGISVLFGSFHSQVTYPLQTQVWNRYGCSCGVNFNACLEVGTVAHLRELFPKQVNELTVNTNCGIPLSVGPLALRLDASKILQKVWSSQGNMLIVHIRISHSFCHSLLDSPLLSECTAQLEGKYTTIGRDNKT